MRPQHNNYGAMNDTHWDDILLDTSDDERIEMQSLHNGRNTRHRLTFFNDVLRPAQRLSRSQKIWIFLALVIGLGIPLIILLRYLLASENEPYAPSTTPVWNPTGFFSTTPTTMPDTTPDITSTGAPTAMPETTALPDTTMPDTTPVTTTAATTTGLPPDERCVPPQAIPECCDEQLQWDCGAKR